MAVNLTFFGWKRSGVYGTVESPALTTEGRLSGEVTLTLRNTEPGAAAEAEAAVGFDIMGPGDVRGLKPAAVVQRVPPPGTPDAESSKCVHVDLAAVDLPWRYTPLLADGLALRPWLVLLVGTPIDIRLESGNRVTVAGTVLDQYDLAKSARWAHVQADADNPSRPTVTRLLSERPLAGFTDYQAVIVPAFAEAAPGQSAWTVTEGVETPAVNLPVYDAWRFSIEEGDDFPTLARRLQPGLPPPDLGRAPLTYPPVPTAPALSVRGALAPIGGLDDPVPLEVDADVFAFTTKPVDPRRPVISVPDYDDAWVAEPDETAWGESFRHDPRHRGVAGIGLWAGIEEQDLLAAAAAAQAGALDIAAQRIRHLTAGLLAARWLWRHRLPTDPVRQLAIFGPALSRMMTSSGTVRDRIAGDGWALPRTIFTSAARRVLRPGPARTGLTVAGALDPRTILELANQCPLPPTRAPGSLPHSDRLPMPPNTPRFDLLIQGAPTPLGLRHLVDTFFARYQEHFPTNPDLIDLFNDTMRCWLARFDEGQPIPLLTLLSILDPPSGQFLPPPDLRDELRQLFGLCDNPDDFPLDTPDLTDLADDLDTTTPDRPCEEVPDLAVLAGEVAAAIDPTADRPLVVDRVLETIQGLDDQPLTPPELCPDLDLPAWTFLRDHAPDWLLPGVEQLEPDRVVAVTTNPTFIDAFLLGLNTQILGELRFRNIPIVAGCTPLRQFWARATPGAETYADDIVGVRNWPDDSPLGDVAHQTTAAADADLVIVFQSPLFRRYPRTLVYLTPAPLVDGSPDWEDDPNYDEKLQPAFQGVITPDITFFGFDLGPLLGANYWVVLEEPPQGVRFFNTTASFLDEFGNPDQDRINQFNTATDGATFADAAFADPFRVLIRGDVLIPGGA